MLLINYCLGLSFYTEHIYLLNTHNTNASEKTWVEQRLGI